MGTIKTPLRVKLISGLIFAGQHVLQQAMERLQVRLGPVDVYSEIFPFTHTDYYGQEMGEGLERVFVAFVRLIRPEQLPEVKILTNGLEAYLSPQKEGRKRRRINIDPGYIETSKLVLASTKNFSHRIYLGRGIYAEVTLQYRHNRFEPFPWTYPDYQTPQATSFLQRARQVYMKQVG